MKTASHAALLLFALTSASPALAGPITAEEGARQAKVLAQLNAELAAARDATVKFAVIGKAMKVERNVEVRRKFLKTAAAIPGPEIEPFLLAVLADDPDAGLRSEAAKLLGERGSPDCLAALDRAAGNDRTTSITIGDIGSQSSARRAATFAIAALVERHPQLAERAVAQLRVLPGPENERDNEGLGDARIQAIYQITRDRKLLDSIFARFRSPDAKVRVDGVVAMRSLKLKEAPAELTASLKDSDADVTRWAALVLGEIGDPKSVPALIEAAADAKADTFTRVNAIHSLGRMKAEAAAAPLEKLLTDPEPRIPPSAAIALYQITGKKGPQYPKGYRAD